MRRSALLVVVLAAGFLFWSRTEDPPTAGLGPAPSAGDTGWSRLEPQDRCHRALELVTSDDRWPTFCRWRHAGEPLQGQSFPPPKGPPPYDDPRIEMYVAPTQSREELASALAHELGHMHHTREPAFEAEWLEARGLPADTPPEVWTEDYAEVFAALFGPPSGRWRAPTPRPSPDALTALKAQFFS